MAGRQPDDDVKNNQQVFHKLKKFPPQSTRYSATPAAPAGTRGTEARGLYACLSLSHCHGNNKVVAWLSDTEVNEDIKDDASRFEFTLFFFIPVAGSNVSGCARSWHRCATGIPSTAFRADHFPVPVGDGDGVALHWRSGSQAAWHG
jgi:hypothetical protein